MFCSDLLFIPDPNSDAEHPISSTRAESRRGDGTPKGASGGRFPEGRQDIEQETREKVQSPLEVGAGKPESLVTEKRMKAFPLGPGSDGKEQEVGCLSKVIKAAYRGHTQEAHPRSKP